MSSSGLPQRLDAAGAVMYERLGTYGALVPPIAVAVAIKAVEAAAGVDVSALVAGVLLVVAIAVGLAGQWWYETRALQEDAPADEPEDADLERSL